VQLGELEDNVKRQNLSLGVVTFSFLFTLVRQAAGAGGVPILVDFEDLSPGTVVFNQYEGVAFINGDITDSGGNHPVTVFAPAQGTISGTRALRTQFSSGCEFCGSSQLLRFDVPQTQVSLSVGLAENNPFGQATYLLQGFAADPMMGGALIVSAVAPCLGSGPGAISTPMEIDDLMGTIRYAQLWLVDCNFPMIPNSGGVGRVLAFDNLLYDRSLNPPPRDTVPPVITITLPQSNQTVIGQVPGDILIDLQTTIAEDALASLSATVNGHAAVPLSYYHTDAHTYRSVVPIGQGDGLVEGANTITVTAIDFGRPPNNALASVSFNYMVKPRPPPVTVDIWPIAYQVTQTIDDGPRHIGNRDLSGDGYRVYTLLGPPMLKGKATLVRIYGAASGATGPIDRVPAVLNLYKQGCDPFNKDCIVAERLPPVSPSNPKFPNFAGITVPPFGAPESVPERVTGDFSRSWNFLLSPEWTENDLRAIITINSGNYIGNVQATPVRECIGGTAEMCYHNNQVEVQIHFIDPPTLTVNPVFIHISGTYKGRTWNDAKPAQVQVDKFITIMNELYPARVMLGARYDRTLSPDQDEGALLDVVSGLSAPNNQTVFLGIFPDDQVPLGTAAAVHKNSDGSFVAGYGAVGGRGAWALASNPMDGAHEIGHNIGFDHWACENGVNNDECDVFPIPHGGTGVWGTDIAGWRIIAPGDNSANTTPHAHDFMTYGQLCELYGGGAGCDLGEWVSWYTYDILLNHMTPDSYDTDDPPALLVRGRIGTDGKAVMRPVYQINVDRPIHDTNSEDDIADIYSIRGYDSSGNTLFVHNFEPTKLDVHTSDYNKVFRIEEPVPMVIGVRRLAVLHGAELLGEILDPAPGQPPQVIIDAPRAGAEWPAGMPQTVRWTASSPAGARLSALVQYSSDGGKTFVNLGSDVSGGTLAVSVDELAGSASAYVSVQVSDGLNTATAVAGPFTVRPKPPVPHIIAPADGDQIGEGAVVRLYGTAYDRQETLRDNQLQWVSDRDGPLGAGQQLSAIHLSSGFHTLTLWVADSAGLSGQDQVHVEVVAAGQQGGCGCKGGASRDPGSILAPLLVAAALLLRHRVLRRRRRASVGTCR
jgi:hypothetical protein